MNVCLHPEKLGKLRMREKLKSNPHVDLWVIAWPDLTFEHTVPGHY